MAVGPAWAPPEPGRGSAVCVGSVQPTAQQPAEGRMAVRNTSVEEERTSWREQTSANRRRRVQDTLAGLTDKHRSASARQNRPAGRIPIIIEPNYALPCAWRIPPEPGHPFPGRWRMGGRVVSERVEQGSSSRSRARIAERCRGEKANFTKQAFCTIYTPIGQYYKVDLARYNK